MFDYNISKQQTRQLEKSSTKKTYQLKNSSTQKLINLKTHQLKNLNYYLLFYNTALIFAAF